MLTDIPVEQRAVIRWHLESVLVWLLIGYFAVCSVTIPFINAWWLGELSVLAVIQLPKIVLAGWLQTEIVMKAIRLLGLSYGSFSPDYSMARPYGLALAYLIPLGIALSAFWLRKRGAQSRLWLGWALVAVALVDYGMTLIFAHQRFLTIY